MNYRTRLILGLAAGIAISAAFVGCGSSPQAGAQPTKVSDIMGSAPPPAALAAMNAAAVKFQAQKQADMMSHAGPPPQAQNPGAPQ